MNRFAATPDRRALLAAIAAVTLLSVSVAFAQPAQAPAPKAEKAGDAGAVKVAPVAPASAEAPAPVEEAAAPAVPKRPLSPMMTEIRALLDADAEQVAALRQRIAKASSPEEALVLQRQIEQLKLDTEVSLLRVQAKHARAAGRTEVASRLEAAISELLNPPKIQAPAARPVPSRENTSR
jgi:hypothetical protein